MKQSKMFIPTLREIPADAEVTSHRLLLRAGYIRQTSSGVYSFLPLGKKVLKKIEDIIREEMDYTGANELLMPTLQQAELWQESQRWFSYGSELMRIRDRHNREFALGPTHEEVITSLVRDELSSYKKLPLTLYQIQTKFRDEKRPRFGLLRGREFVMKDAYSFHSTQESLNETYEDLFKAYQNVFTRCGLNFRTVIADSGEMGGKDTHEFMVLSEIGEDTIAFSDTSDYAANIEVAPVIMTYEKSDEQPKELEKVKTINVKTIDEVTSFFQVEAKQCVKALFFHIDQKPVLVLVRGDHEVNSVKLKKSFDAATVDLATHEETRVALNCAVGSVGPIGVDTIEIIADNAVASIVNGVCGANENDYHFINVNPGRDFKVAQYSDLRFIKEGDASPDGRGTIEFAKGIEVGHVFKLGTRYSEAMGAFFLDENGRNKPMIMGCYGIGVSRLVAAVAEQYNDEKGLVWPKQLAPFHVHVTPINVKNEEQSALSEQLYSLLRKQGYDVLLDDRNERAGVKFNDSELIGIPVRITIGKKAAEGIVEVNNRSTGNSIEVHVSNLNNVIAEIFA